jgi:hemoglobin-like flavoprotein
MDAQTILLVQSSWVKVKPISDVAGQLFYSNLFEQDPALRALFKGDVNQQAAKLMQMVDVAVGKLNQLDVLVPVLEQLGKRHVGYGVQAQHYDTVGSALLKTLEQGLGADFTPDVKAAWTDVYGVMAKVMQS